METRANQQVVLHFGVTLRQPPPRRSGRPDCTCLFCCLFRTKHLVWRAVAMTAFVVPVVWFTSLLADVDFSSPGGADSYGIFLIVSTASAFMALATWYQPLRRLKHIRRPKITAWPPPW